MTDPPQPSIDLIMKKIYEIYSDYCVKNPFHTPEMPIRADLFDTQLLKLVKSVGGLVLSSPTATNPYTVNISNSGVAGSGQQSSTSSPTPTMVNTGS